MAMNIQIQDEKFLELTNKSFFFSAENIQLALKKSNLSEQLYFNSSLINSFDLISGHTELNLLIEDYIKRDFEDVTKQLYFKPEIVETLRKNLISQGTKLKIVSLRLQDNILTKNEASILLSNLIDVINEKISIEFDQVDMGLKKISPLEFDYPLTSLEINQINSRLILIREYIQILNTDYASFAPDINMKIVLSDLDNSEDLFNYVIQQSLMHKEIVEKSIRLDIDAISKRIEALNMKIAQISTVVNEKNNTRLSDENSAISADASFIDTILLLGEKASSVDRRDDYLEKINILENSMISLERRLEDLNINTSFDLTFDDAKSYLIQSLNKSSKKINLYIDKIKKVSQVDHPLKKLSTAYQSSETYLNKLLEYFIYLFIASFVVGFFILTLNYILISIQKN